MRLFKAKTWNEAWSTLPTWAQEKRDGHRYMIERAKNGVMFAFSTSFINEWERFQAYAWAKAVADSLPPGYQLDAELFVEGGTSEDVKTALSAHDPALKLAPFATTYLPDDVGMDLVNEHFASCGLEPPPIVRTAQNMDTADTLLGYAMAKNIEGWILKNGNYLDWFKLKCERTIDLIVASLKPGKHKYTATTGAIVCVALKADGERREVAAVSGMNEDVRFALSANDIGRVVEVKYQRVGHGGRLLLPRFLRWRDDKTGVACTIDQDPTLEQYWTAR